jgi:hypothetical protein
MRLAVSRAVFRLGPAWSVVAGAVAVGALRPDAAALLRVLTAAVLADVAWGAIRQVIPIVPVGSSMPVPPAQVAPVAGPLPYAQPDAPLARWLAALTPAHSLDMVLIGEQGTPTAMTLSQPGAWQGVLVISGLALILSVLLGWPAVVLTVVAVVTIWAAAAIARRGELPALAHSLLDVGWPWLLGVSLAAGGLADVEREGIGLSAPPGILLAAAFTTLQWGIYRVRHAALLDPGKTPFLAWFGQLAVVGVLVGLRLPWAVACVAALLAAPSFWLARVRPGAWSGALPWWWAASLVAAIAAR